MTNHKTITINNQTINYLSRVNSQARRLRLIIHSDGQLTVSRPRWLSERKVEKFIKKKEVWIIEKINYFKSKPLNILRQGSRQDYLDNKNKARELIQERLDYFNQFYNFKYQRFSVRDQKTRWGSCSKKGNLNFNYHLIYLAPAIRDYIIVHELCHLKEMNHSPRFWNLVAKTAPNYMQRRKELKNKLS